MDITGDDEARDVGVVRDMVGSGEWLVPQFNSAFRYETERPSNLEQHDQLLPVYSSEALQTKPPLFYWAAGLSAMVRHRTVDEWTARLPSAVFGAAVVAVTVIAGARMIGVVPAFLGGLMLATMPMFHGWARLARCDMLLVFLVACFLFVYHLSPDPLPRSSRLTLWTLIALCVLNKGLAGPGLLVTIIVLDAFLAGHEPRIRPLIDPAGIAIFVAMIGGWFALAASKWGTAFVFRHFVVRNFSYFLPDSLSGSGGPRGWSHHLSHFVNIFTNTAPWGLFLPAALIGFWRLSPPERPRHSRFLVVWLTGGLFYFTMSARKSPYYLLPLYPAVALIVAELLAKPTIAAFERGVFRRVSWVGFLVSIVGATIFLLAIPQNFAAFGSLAELVHASPPIPIILTIAGLAALLPAIVSMIWAREWGEVTVLALPAMMIGFTLQNFLDPATSARISMRPFATEIRRHIESSDRVFFFEETIPAVALYSRLDIPTLFDTSRTGPEPFFLIVPESLIEHLPERWRAEGRVVVEGRGRVFAHRVMGIELLEMTPRRP